MRNFSVTVKRNNGIAGSKAGVLIWAVLALLLWGVSFQPGQASDFRVIQKIQSEVVIEGRGDRHRFNVELAATASHRAQGLMYREEISDSYGMLFVFDEVAPVVMWMKNTFISLDMLFVDEAGRIVHIAHSTTPLSLTRIPSRYPVLAVLEIRGGLSRELGIEVGDRLVHEVFARVAPE